MAKPKYQYPVTKPCEHCGAGFLCNNSTQVQRNRFCLGCRSVGVKLARKLSARPPEEHACKVQIACTCCGKVVLKNRAWIKNVREPTCSRTCNSKIHGARYLAGHEHKASAARTPEGYARWLAAMSGPNNPAWRGGITLGSRRGNHKGARYTKCPTAYLAMARPDGYVAEHRLRLAEAIGRVLSRNEVVHHVNHDSHDNRAANLMLFASQSDHKRYEHHGTPQPIWDGRKHGKLIADPADPFV